MHATFLRISAILLLVFGCFLGRAEAQWQAIPFPPGVNLIAGVYFWNTTEGAVLTNTGLYFTRDGSTLLPANTPSIISSPNCLRFVDGKVLALVWVGSTSEVWETTDRGKSWQFFAQVLAGNAHDLYFRPDGKIVTIYEEKMGGSTFLRVPNSPKCFSILDDGNGLYVSNDSGLTWHTRSISTVTGFGLHYNPISKRLFTVPENDQAILVSDDEGVSWRSMTPPSPNQFVSDEIEGVDSILYVQGYGAASGGMYRSTDDGVNWQSIGGPISVQDDQRFFVGGCHGELVVAWDEIALWINNLEPQRILQPRTITLGEIRPAAAGDTVSITIDQKGFDVSKGLDLSLTFDQDLLGFFQVMNPTIRLIDSGTIAGSPYYTFHIDSLSEEHPFTTLKLKAFLTTHDSTLVEFVDASQDTLSTSAANCVAVPTGNSHIFRLTKQCDDSTIQRFMLGDKVDQFLIYPNPANGSVTLHFQSEMKGTADLQIINAQGVIVQQLPVPPLRTALTLPTSMLESGSYIIRVRSDHSTAEQHLIIER